MRTIVIRARTGEQIPRTWRGPVLDKFGGHAVWAPIGPAYSTDGRVWEAAEAEGDSVSIDDSVARALGWELALTTEAPCPAR